MNKEIKITTREAIKTISMMIMLSLIVAPLITLYWVNMFKCAGYETNTLCLHTDVTNK